MKKILKRVVFLTILLLSLVLLVSTCSASRVTKPRMHVRYAVAEGAIIGALASVLGGLGVASLNASKNREQWEDQNAYNTPASQMSRYRAAGLNPNVIYGSGQASAGNAGAIAPYHAEHVGSSDLLAAANAISVIKNTDANARKADAEALGAELDNTLKSTQLQYYGSNLDLQNKLAAARLGYISGQTNLQQYQQKVLEAQAQNLVENALFTKSNRLNFQPVLLSLRRQEVVNATDRLGWDMSILNPLNRERSLQGDILDKDLFFYESDRRFSRRVRALDAATNAVGAGGRFFRNLLFPSMPRTIYNPRYGYGGYSGLR